MGSFDILIIGGGMVGASLACALGESDYRVGLVEARPLNASGKLCYDDRSTALAYGSRRIFEQMSLWPELEKLAEPILSIHVSDRGHFGVSRLAHTDEGVEALGYVVENPSIEQVLLRRLVEADNIEVMAPARVAQIDHSAAAVELQIWLNNKRHSLKAPLLIAADGTSSPVRKLLGLRAREVHYGQTALIANVTTELGHRNTAYERFTDSGPLAVLPLRGARCSVVMSIHQQETEELMSLDDDAFLHRLQSRFGYRLGRFVRTGQRLSYPLLLVETESQRVQRTLLLGNAARTLHPVAGQGFNLALRDVAALAEVLLQASYRGGDPGDPNLLEAFLRERRRDQFITVAFTDTLARLFSNRLAPLAPLRSVGLLAVDLLPFLRHGLARRSMGLSERLPRLAPLG